MRHIPACFVAFLSCLFLASCSGVSSDRAAEEIQRSFRDADSVAFDADVRADYGDRTFDFGVKYQSSGDMGLLSVTSPEIIAGATVRIGDGGAVLAFDGAEVYTGEILPEGLSPVDAMPVMVSSWRDGLITETVREKLGDEDCVAAVFRVDDRVDLRTWFDGEGLPLRAEFSFDGYTVVSADFYDMKVE